MITKLKNVAEKIGITYDKKRTMMYGKYQDYNVSALEITQQREYLIFIPAKMPESSEQTVNMFLMNLSNTHTKVKNAQFNKNCFYLTMKISRKGNDNIQAIINLIDEVISFCKMNLIDSCCELCCETNETSIVSVNGRPIALCDNCFEQVKNDASKIKEENKSNKGNPAAGAVGAFLGSLIGVVLWVIIYQLGYIAAIAGFVLIICSIKGYELFSKKMDVLGVIISVSISAIMLFFAQNLCLAIEIQKAFGESYGLGFFDSFKLISEFLKEPEIKSGFFTDLGIGYLLMIIGSIRTIMNIIKQANNPIEVTKLTQNFEDNISI